ncbi:MAG: glycosyltransferase family 39 protein [Puniceicoccales bacterium]|jgi:arabinofuranosyltransferase|nr:glycosyltransferase family 39 protein [Puniceicoccales bacterium]
MSLLDNDKIENYNKTKSAGSLVQPTDNQIVTSSGEGGNFFVTNKIRTACVLFFSLVVILLAWQCDDAYHSHKMSLNFANGNGLVYNVGERVNASTCPLHTIIIGCFYKVFGNMYLTSLLLCAAYSISAFVLLLRSSCRNNYQAVLVTMALVFSTSFVSFTTSGLENPLLFLLFSILLHVFWGNEKFSPQKLVLSSFIGGLILMTRMDNGLFLFPLLVFMLAKREKVSLPKAMVFMALGMVPFFLWELFSIVYYGFPFPNTAYAKLATGIPRSEYWVHGIGYYIGSFLSDPLVLLLPVSFLLFSVSTENAKGRIVACGILLYFVYLLHIGGDFMRGRHFTVLFFITIFSLFRLTQFSSAGEEEKSALLERKSGIALLRVPKQLVFLFTVCAIGVFFPGGTRNFEMGSGIFRRTQGVFSFSWLPIDERAFYFPATSMFFNKGKLFKKQIESDFIKTVMLKPIVRENWEIKENQYRSAFETFDALKKTQNRGKVLRAPKLAFGFIMVNLAGEFYISDTIGLGDPLLSRLPAKRGKDWKVGHLHRNIPEGYQESIQTGENKIKDPALAKYLSLLWDITRSEELFTWNRLQKIINFNLGSYDHLKNEYVRRQNGK